MRKSQNKRLYDKLKGMRKDEIIEYAMNESSNRNLYRLLKPMTKGEIKELSQYTCRHYHTFIDHPNCFFKEDSPVDRIERVGILDLETFSFQFKSDMSVILCYTIKGFGEDNMKSNWLKPEELTNGVDSDRRLIQDAIKDMEKYDRLVGHNIKKFDLPMLRSRAVRYKLQFPVYRTIFVTDTLRVMWKKFNLKSGGLRNACKFFDIDAKDTPFEYNTWVKAIQGNEKAMGKVVDHCEEDVIANEELYDRISYYTSISRTSI